jgi:hypothetical protein
MSEPQKYREMTTEEREPWDRWLQSALKEQRVKIYDTVGNAVATAIEAFQKRLEDELPKHFALREELDELKAENLQLRALISKKSWWWQ